MQPATEKEVHELSVRFNGRLQQLCQEPSSAFFFRGGSIGGTQHYSWFRLFKEMDANSSGLISLDELEFMLREHMHMHASELPDLQLRKLWLALDTDSSGSISVGEFSAFMRIGNPAPWGRSGARSMRRSPSEQTLRRSASKERTLRGSASQELLQRYSAAKKHAAAEAQAAADNSKTLLGAMHVGRADMHTMTMALIGRRGRLPAPEGGYVATMAATR